MNDKQLTILIDGREALPVRAIPYVSGWDRFPPRLVAEYLYLGNDKFGGVMGNRKLGTKSPSLLTAYQLTGNTPVLVQPREWYDRVIAFDGLEAQLKREYGDSENGDKEANANWRRKAVEMLPEGVFVWLNEFETAFKAGRGRPGSFGRKRGDDGLNLTPMLHDAATRTIVMAGFETLPAAPAGKVEAKTVTSQSGDAPHAIGGLEVFCSMKNLSGDELNIAFVGDKPEPNSDIGVNNFLEISARGETRRIALAALDLVNKQSGGLNRMGVMLLGFAQHLEPPDSGANAQTISRLRQLFNEHLGFASDPFDPKAAKWKPRFKIADKRGAADERVKRKAERNTISYELMNERGERVGDTREQPYDDEGDAAAEWLMNNAQP